MTAADLERLYAAASRELMGLFRAIRPEEFNATQDLEIRRRTAEIVSALNLAGRRWTETALAEAYLSSSRKARTAVAILGRKRGPKTVEQTPRRVIDAAYERILRANISIKKTVSDRLAIFAAAGAALRALPERALAQEFQAADRIAEIHILSDRAIKADQARGVLQRTLRALLADLVTEDSLIEIKGKNWRITKYAKLLARTEMRFAQTKATLDTCWAYDNDLVQWSEHGGSCDDCEPFEGEIYSLSGTHPKYPALVEQPPLHPNCRHSLLPTSDEAVAVREKYK